MQLVSIYYIYQKSGTYSTITNNGDYSGDVNNDYDFVTDTSLSWRIWSVSETTITLVADKPATVGGYKNIGGLSLSNCNGYNNGVKILNDICNACYSNSKYNAISRSLNEDDIEGVLDIEKWSPKRYKSKKTEARTYTGRKEYTVNIGYPYIYSEEEFSSIDGIEIEELVGVKKSEQLFLYGPKETYLKAKSVLNPLQTAWTNSDMDKDNFVHENYYYLIFNEGFEEKETLMSYFLASRSVDLSENHINFGMFEVSMGKKITTGTLYNSRGGGLEYWDRVRPIVEIPLENISLDRSTDGLTKETAWRIE